MKYKHIIIPAVFFLFLFLSVAGKLKDRDDLDAKIAQMLIVGFRGYELNEDMAIVKDIRERNLGGVILFNYDVPAGIPERNIQSPDQLRSLNRALQNAADDHLIIAIDQEGGRVNRLKEGSGFPATVSHHELGILDDVDSTRQFAGQTAALLAGLSFNLNFAPVVDVNTNPDNPIIGKLGRSFSDDPGRVARHAEAFVSAHREHGILTAVKHFPGHGSAWNDSHLGLADVTETWHEAELEPYRYLVDHDRVDMIMTAHIFNEQLDPDYPATLSKKIITGMLREDLGYDGVIVSDDMQMGAITNYYGLEQALKLSINAGVDMLIFANNSVYDEDITERAIALISKLVESGEIPGERIEESYRRIRELKRLNE